MTLAIPEQPTHRLYSDENTIATSDTSERVGNTNDASRPGHRVGFRANAADKVYGAFFKRAFDGGQLGFYGKLALLKQTSLSATV